MSERRRPPPTSAEIGLVVVAGYESQLRMQAAQAKRRFHVVGCLSAVAGLVLAYDVLRVLFSR